MMATLFGPAWILQALLASWGLMLVFVFVHILRGIWWPPISVGSEPAGVRLDGDTVDQGRLAAFPPVLQLFLGRNGQ